MKSNPDEQDNTLRPLVALSRSRKDMQLIIHRGARQVGGSCVELTFNDSTILLDIGLPLDSDFNDDPESYLPQPLFNELKNGKKLLRLIGFPALFGNRRLGLLFFSSQFPVFQLCQHSCPRSIFRSEASVFVSYHASLLKVR